MPMLKEFKQFAMRGNVVDMAVGIIIGAAFGKIVTSLVTDVIMPPIGLLLGEVHFSALALTLRAAEGDNPAVTLNYGAFIQTTVDFLLIALAVFMVVKSINRLRQQQETQPEEAPPPPPEQRLLAEIRDLLKAREEG